MVMMPMVYWKNFFLVWKNSVMYPLPLGGRGTHFHCCWERWVIRVHSCIILGELPFLWRTSLAHPFPYVCYIQWHVSVGKIIRPRTLTSTWEHACTNVSPFNLSFCSILFPYSSEVFPEAVPNLGHPNLHLRIYFSGSTT